MKLIKLTESHYIIVDDSDIKEEWIDIAGYNQYQVSNYGRVKTTANSATRKERILKPYKMAKGYLYVDLWINGKHKKHRIHKLVAIAFIPNPENKNEINHIDGNKENNHISNLEWCTHKENIKHSMDNNLVLKGEIHPMFGTKRTEETKQKIKNSLLGRKHTEEAKLKMSKSKIKQ